MNEAGQDAQLQPSLELVGAIPTETGLRHVEQPRLVHVQVILLL